MDFSLNEDLRQIQETAHNFAVRELQPIARECDREEKHPSREIVKKAARAGLLGVFIPKEYGGPGLGFFGLALVAEQLSCIDMGLGMFAVLAPTFGSENILFFGTEAQKQIYLPRLLKGELLSSGAYTEPESGTDIVSASTTASKQGDKYIVNGSKIFITNGTVCDFLLTFCVTHPEEDKTHKRHSLILIESDRDGITRTKLTGKMGIRASDTAEIYFSNVHVPRQNLIGEEGKGFYHLMHFFDVSRIMISAQGIGVAQGALDQTVSYLKAKKGFTSRFATSQGIQFDLAEMATRIELARTLTYRAAWHIDQNQIDTKMNSMAKYYAGETAVWVSGKAMSLFDGYGYLPQYDIQRFFRDAKIIEIYEGTKEAEKIVIARRVFG